MVGTIESGWARVILGGTAPRRGYARIEAIDRDTGRARVTLFDEQGMPQIRNLELARHILEPCEAPPWAERVTLPEIVLAPAEPLQRVLVLSATPNAGRILEEIVRAEGGDAQLLADAEEVSGCLASVGADVLLCELLSPAPGVRELLISLSPSAVARVGLLFGAGSSSLRFAPAVTASLAAPCSATLLRSFVRQLIRGRAAVTQESGVHAAAAERD